MCHFLGPVAPAIVKLIANYLKHVATAPSALNLQLSLSMIFGQLKVIAILTQ